MDSCYGDLKRIRDARHVELLSNCMSPALDRLRSDYPEGAGCYLNVETVDQKYIAFYSTKRRSITLNSEDIKVEDSRTRAYWLLVLFHEYKHALQHARGVITAETGRMYKEEGYNDVKLQTERDADAFALGRFWRLYAGVLGRGGMQGYLDFLDARRNYLPKSA